MAKVLLSHDVTTTKVLMRRGLVHIFLKLLQNWCPSVSQNFYHNSTFNIVVWHIIQNLPNIRHVALQVASLLTTAAWTHGFSLKCLSTNQWSCVCCYSLGGRSRVGRVTCIPFPIPQASCATAIHRFLLTSFKGLPKKLTRFFYKYIALAFYTYYVGDQSLVCTKYH